MPRLGGSPRCLPPPGTPGSPPTWPRSGPASSPWGSCHDRRRVQNSPQRAAPPRWQTGPRPPRCGWCGGTCSAAAPRPPSGCWPASASSSAAALHWRWNIAGGPAAQDLIPLTIEAGAAAVIAVTTLGPFGDPERAGCCWLLWLRLAAAVALTAAAFGALPAGAGAGVAVPEYHRTAMLES